jgi:hypothetical protein
MIDVKYKAPFDMRFVLSVTIIHMQRCITSSIEKTFNRIPEFEGDVDKSTEIFKTLAMLHGMRNKLNQMVLTTGEKK